MLLQNNLLYLIITIITITAFILSMIAILKDCKDCKDKFAADVLDETACYNNSHMNVNNCINTMNALSQNIDTAYWGQPGNRGLYEPSGAISGSFGNPEVIN